MDSTDYIAIAGIVSSIATAAAFYYLQRRDGRSSSDDAKKAALRQQIADLAGLTNIGIFYSAWEREDPVEMFWAMHGLRTTLQLKNAANIPDPEAAAAFGQIRDAIYAKERLVQQKFGRVAELAFELRREHVDHDAVKRQLGEAYYYDAKSEMFMLRQEVEVSLAVIQRRLKELE
jgi:hypothetical protein